MIILQAPYESIQFTTILPNPEFSDTINNEVGISVKRSMNGTLYSYVKTSDRKKLIYDFNMTREKSLELLEFIKVYHYYNIKMTNFKGEVWNVKLITDLHDLTAITIGEYQTIRLEMSGIKIA